MPFKDKEAQRKLMADRRAKAKRDNETQAKTPVIPAKTVIPAVIPTQADVDSGKAWVVLTGPLKGSIRWYGPLAQKWRNVPCEIVAGVCMTEHAPGSVTPHESHDYRYDTRKLESLLGRLNVRLGVEDA